MVVSPRSDVVAINASDSVWDAACAQEPIHAPGAIQPHGALLVLTPGPDLFVVAASDNAADFLGINPLGCRFGTLVDPSFLTALQDHAAAGDLEPSLPWAVILPARTGRRELEVTAHAQGGLILIELEPVQPDAAAQALAASRQLQRWIGCLRAFKGSLAELALLVSQGIRLITGYERVLVYQFDADWHGQTIAEDKVEDWAQSFLGLHFPASDIPRQARVLYHDTLLRWVPARDYEPVPLQVDPSHQVRTPFDLTYSHLRSLSPVHLQYHRNMGVDGSMSLSVMQNGQLWGLVVCHHRRPHYVSAGQRAAAAALADAFALRLGPAERAHAEEVRRTDMQRLSQLLADMADADDVAAALTTGSVTLDTLFGASGAAAVHAGKVVTVGRTPSPRDLLALADWLRDRPEQAIFCTNRLPLECPAFASQGTWASGLLAVFLSSDRSEMLLWFRPEEPQLVNWGGDPRKQTESNTAHPMPRQSFERWVEIRRGHARPWRSWELEIADMLRHAIMEVIIRNFNRLTTLNEQLRQAQKMEVVGQLTGGIAHDFNNLLTGISGSLELLKARVAQGRLTEVNRYVLAAQGAASRAAALTHRLLAFARQQRLEPKPTDANRLITGLEELIQRTIGPGIILEVALAVNLWATLCDPHQLENALLNLCINARDAMPQGGRLTIETTNVWLDERGARERDMAPGQYAALCVTDTGVGMTPEVAARAFDPFFTTKPVGQGTGLGLSMIYGFAKQSDGQMRIYSEPGQGTTMRLYLPRYRGDIVEHEASPTLPERARSGQGETVLVVDDEPTVRMLVADVLRDLDYTAIEAEDGFSGLRMLQSKARLDLLITDIGLPGGMNGRQLAEHACQLYPGLKVLFITGYAENAVLNDVHLKPNRHVISKPFAMEALASRVQTILRTR